MHGTIPRTHENRILDIKEQRSNEQYFEDDQIRCFVFSRLMSKITLLMPGSMDALLTSAKE